MRNEVDNCRGISLFLEWYSTRVRKELRRTQLSFYPFHVGDGIPDRHDEDMVGRQTETAQASV
jgi:hypothetical protein